MCGVIGIWGNDHVVRDLYQGLLAIQHRGQDSPPASSPTTAGSTPRRATASSATSSRPRASSACAATSASATPATRRSAAAAARTPSRSRSTRRSASSWPTTATSRTTGAQGRALREAPPPAQLRLRRRDHPQRLRPGARRAEDAGPRARARLQGGRGRLQEGPRELLGRRLHRRPGDGRLPRSRSASSPWSTASRNDGLVPSYAVASETVSLNLMNFGDIKSVEPGQAVFFDRDRKVHTKRLSDGRHTPCLFEWVYFARPDSFIDNANVYKVRVNLGRFLADGDPAAQAPHRRRRARARLGPRRGHRDRPEARPEIQRGPGQEPLHRPDVHHARRRQAARARSARSSTPSPPSSRASASSSSTTASSGATRRGPSSRWSGSAGRRRSTSPRTRPRSASPASTASTCRPRPSSWPGTPTRRRWPSGSARTRSSTRRSTT